MAALRSISFMWLASFGAAGFALLTQMLIARSVTPVDYGLYAGSVTVAAMLAPLAGLGVPGFFLRVFGEEGKAGSRWVKASATAMSVSLTLGVFFCVAYASYMRRDWEGIAIGVALAPLILSFVGAEIAMSRYQVEENHLGVSLWTLIPNTLRVLVAATGWLLKWPLDWIAMGIGGVSAVVGLLAASTLLKAKWNAVPANSKFTPLEIQGHIGWRTAARRSWPFGVSNFVFLVFFQSGVLMLEGNNLHAEAGVFSLALSILTAVYLIPTVVSQRFFMVKFHRWAAHNKTQFLRVFRATNGLALAGGGAIAIALALFSPFFVNLLFGAAYVELGYVLQMASIAVPARYLSCFLGSSYSTVDDMKPRLRAQVIVAAVMVPTTLMAIQFLGLAGAVAMMVVSEWTLAAAYLYGCSVNLFGGQALTGWTLDIRQLK